MSLSIAKTIADLFFKIDLVKLPGPEPISIIVDANGFDCLTILSVKFRSNKKF